MIRLLAVLLFAVFAAGCGSALDGAVRTVNASQAALKGQHDGLEEVQRATERVIVETAATEAEARARLEAARPPFTRAWDAYDRARIAWLVAHAAAHAAVAADAAGKTPDLPHVLALVGASATAWEALLRAIEKIPAGATRSPVAGPPPAGPAPAAPPPGTPTAPPATPAATPLGLAWSYQ